jgi:hypothetical protein
MQNQRPMWEKISVWQYQQIYNALNSKDKDATDLDLEVKLVAIVNNITEMQVDSLPLDEYKELSKSIAFLSEPIKGRPVKWIPITKTKRYRVVYDISKMPFARYIESKVFSEDLYGNLHKLAATMVVPEYQKRFYIWHEQPYDASKHQEYANDMLTARFIDVYNSLVFFYQVYRNWIEVSRDYMEKRLIETGMTKDKAKEVVVTLCSILDGSIAPNLLPTTKIAKLRKHMI